MAHENRAERDPDDAITASDEAAASPPPPTAPDEASAPDDSTAPAPPTPTEGIAAAENPIVAAPLALIILADAEGAVGAGPTVGAAADATSPPVAAAANDASATPAMSEVPPTMAPPPAPDEAVIVVVAEEASEADPLPVADPPPLTAPPVQLADPAEDGAGEVPSGGAVLDELILPSAIQGSAPLPDGSTVGPDGRLHIERLLDTRGRLNLYHGIWRGDDGTPLPVEVREAPADAPDLRREAEVLAQVRYAMLPTLVATFEQDGRRYLALDRREGETLAAALVAGLTLERALSIVLQLVQVLRRLHLSGWALLGLHPANVTLGHPLRLSHFGTAARIGQQTERALHVAGHTAPEVAQRAVVTGKEDVYTLGTLLYGILVGSPVPEQGPELAALSAQVRVPGGPQLLRAALAPVEERAELETFYRHLLDFKQRLAGTSLALQVVSGTTVGLNPTRIANEDACVYTLWSLTHHERSIYRAVLCVVDGMGGMEAGEVASRAAVQAVLEAIPAVTNADDQGPPDPVLLVQAATRSVYMAAQGRAVGATITCVVVDDGVLSLAHVGDTRAYLLREGALTQLTHDHSLVASMVASGMLTKAEARGHPDSNKVLRSLGSQQELPDGYIDTLTATRADATLLLCEGDILLLCSDGVWGVLDDDTLCQIIRESPDDPTAVRTIIARVLAGGAPDNATLIIARCDRMPTH